MTPAISENGENVVGVVNEHWIKYLMPVMVSVFLLLISIILFLLAGISAHHYMWLSHTAYVAALLLFFLTFHWFFMLLLGESLDRIIITNRRLIRLEYSILLHEDVLEVSFEKMKTVDARMEGFIENIFRYGTLYFENKASIPLIPHPNRVAKIIQGAIHQNN